MPPSQQALFAVMSVLLVTGSALASGLTLGLLSLDELDLEVGGCWVVQGSPHAAAQLLLPFCMHERMQLCSCPLRFAGCMHRLHAYMRRLCRRSPTHPPTHTQLMPPLSGIEAHGHTQGGAPGADTAERDQTAALAAVHAGAHQLGMQHGAPT